MTIHNHAPHATTSIPVGSERHQTPSSIKDRVEGVAFDVLFSKEPETEQLRFKLTETKKTGSSYYTIVTWKGKRYRITVHDNKRCQAYSEKDWKQVEHRTIKVLDKVQNDKHFFRGTLQLQAKTRNKWKVTYENNTPQVERSVNKKVIREFKNLLEKQIKPTGILPAIKAPLKRKASNLAALDTPSKQAKTEEISFPKKIIEKAKNFISHLKSNTNEQNTAIGGEKERSPLRQVKKYFFPSSNNLNNVDDLASSDTSITSFEEIANQGDDDFDDNTSAGGITTASSHVSSDSRSDYSLGISKR